jgi:hypothetical protein
MKSITETKETLADADPDLSALHRRLSTIGAQLHRTGNRQGMLESILFEARSIAHAEAGSLYLAQNGRLRFVAVQNDPLGHEQITARLLGKEISIDAGSLAGYVAMTGQIMHVSDGDDMPPDGPFRIHREFDSLTGYRAKSFLATPLICPEGLCVGVLELFNGAREHKHAAFRENAIARLSSVCGMAATAISNVLLHEQFVTLWQDTMSHLSVVAGYCGADTSKHVHLIDRTSAVVTEAVALAQQQIDAVRYANPMSGVGNVWISDAIV